MMISTSNRNTAVQFWLADLGVQDLPPGVQVQAHAATAKLDLGNRAVYFESGNRVIVTAPPEFVPELIAAYDHSELSPIDTFVTTMATKGRIVGNGPAYVGCLDSLDGSDIEICQVSKDDERVHKLAQDYPNDWDVFGLTEDCAGLFAVVSDSKVLGLSHYEIWGGVIAHIGVVTDPSSRGRGIGERVVRQAAQEALKNGLVPQYRTLWSNKPSIRIAEKLRFSHFATTVVVRCGEE
jgi:GNAT superfamily N-acetyltransferase